MRHESFPTQWPSAALLLLTAALWAAPSAGPACAQRGRKAASEHWSLRPVVEAPALAAWSPERRARPEAIDALLAQAQRRLGLEPAPLAPRRTLIRRLSFDVRGLPPTHDEVEAYLRDREPGAWERLVDRMLETRAHAEHQARLWLDVARYADTAGDSSDFPLPEAWRYRDWVIRAMASDMPWRDFVRMQLAGDRIDAQTREARGGAPDADAIVASGYIALSRRFGVLVRQWPHLVREDTLDTIGRGFLGLTLSCARCHDHKFDPITQRDYAALDGIFASTRYPHPGCERVRAPQDLVDLLPPRARDAALGKWKAREAAARAAADKAERAYKKARSAANKSALDRARKKLTALLAERPDVPQAYSVVDAAQVVDSRVQIGGVPKARGERVARGVPRAIVGPEPPRFTKDASGRLALADWLVDPRHPLVPRVLVNRLWQQCFGRGIVATPDDFGTRGAPPSLPALLDHLALRFVEDGSIRASLRRILLTEAYRRESPASERDPENRAFARQTPRRLRAECYRDALLQLSGDLELGSPGPHPFPPVRKWARYSQHNPFVAAYPSLRRSIYVMRQRLRAHGVFDVFDGADTCSVTGKRGESTVPTQALWLRNSDFARARVESFARRYAPERDLALAADRATRAALARPASAREVAELRGFVQRARERGADWKHAWRSWCHVLLCSTEFAYVR